MVDFDRDSVECGGRGQVYLVPVGAEMGFRVRGLDGEA